MLFPISRCRGHKPPYEHRSIHYVVGTSLQSFAAATTRIAVLSLSALRLLHFSHHYWKIASPRLASPGTSNNSTTLKIPPPDLWFKFKGKTRAKIQIQRNYNCSHEGQGSVLALMEMQNQMMYRETWMYGLPRASSEYLHNFKKFLKVVEDHRVHRGESYIWCPCKMC
ncbi:uncharacterized protein LOC122197095 [Lactuca sativa]|uniref:uncharacterized protein LOC122197095 n=1 Tax=Lactuca sativa TaxID=4236 RepID=UPI0022B0738C|nr:uncharacterized protein LOC122197095 [Lactuca sativa]